MSNKGKMAAGVVFHSWVPEYGVIEISGAAEDRRWFSGNVRKAIFDYAFTHHRMVVTKTEGTNGPVLKIWRALGATEYEIGDFVRPGEPIKVFTLTADQWRASRLYRG